MNRFLIGHPGIPQNIAPGDLSPRVRSTSEEANQDGPTWRYGGLVTYEKPITELWEDITIPVNAAGSTTVFRAGDNLPNNCVGLRFINLVAGVFVAFNGRGERTILNGDVLTGVEIQSMIVRTDATGTCVIQAVGTGD